MKRILFIVAILALVSSLSMAQLGIKAGLNFATLGGADASQGGISPKNRTGLTAGVTYDIGLVLGLAIQPGVSYTQKGAVYEMPGAGKTTMQDDYIDIPVVVKWSFLPLPVVKPYVQGGVCYSILSGAKWKYESPLGSGEQDVKDNVAKNDLSIVLGAGANVALGVITLNVDARYVIGQTKIIGKDLDLGTEIIPTSAKLYNQGFMLTAGLVF